ncbi:MAG: hypothetical protein PHO92_04135, partial [Candidatus Peribacteraceae bacterium]|nr:hypothetical protein [Candidatus Peribacteraceae bacterium]
AAHHATALWKLSVGKWEEAVTHLAQSDNVAVAKAASLDRASPRAAEELLACAQAWMAAGASDAGNAKQWYERAAAQLYRAKELKPAGKTGLDIATAVTVLKGKGVEVGPGGTAAVQKPTEVEEAFPKGKWVNIPVTSIDPKAAYRGEIAINGDVITSKGRARFILPVQIGENASYEITYKFMRTRGDDTIGISIPVGNNRVAVLLSTGNGRYSGIDNIGGKGGEKNGTAFAGKFLNNRPYEVRIAVLSGREKTRIAVYINDRLCTSWEGPSATLSEELDHVCGVPGTLSLSSNEDATQFSNIQLRKIDGDITSTQTHTAAMQKSAGVEEAFPKGKGVEVGGGSAGTVSTEQPKQPTEPFRPRNVPREAVYWNGSWYLFPTGKFTLPEANLLARKLRGKVLIISSDEENDFVAKKISDPTFLGTIKKGAKWVTLEGNDQTYFRWDTQRGEPGGNEPYSALMPSGYWHDVQHTDRNCIVIEWGEEKPKNE